MRNSRLSSNNNVFLSEASDINPMESVANIVDVMLVFACGLLLALVTVWNVDIGIDRTNMSEDMVPVDSVSETTSDDVSDDSLQEAGTVYYDPSTGKYYLKSN